MIPIYFASRRAAINEANRLTAASEQQHECHFKGGWLVRNLVTKVVTDAFGNAVQETP